MTILVIHTGGTIAMVAGPAGLMPQEGLLESQVAQMGHVVEVLTLSPLIDSASASFSDWNRIAAVIEAGHDTYNGFVVTHGTDTLAFTAAALTFALAGLQKPVVLTGAMLPFGAQGTDANRNLADAIQAAQTAPAGVWVQFGGKLMHGAKLRKTNSHDLNAFDSEISAKPPLIAAPQLIRTTYHKPDLAILSMAPNQSTKAQTALLAACDGVVLRVFGAGTIPDDPALLRALNAAQDKDVLMIAVSQSPLGGVTLGTYAAGAPLLAAGVVDGGTMTPEAAYAKLAHVLSHDAGFAAQRARLATDLCGES